MIHFLAVSTLMFVLVAPCAAEVKTPALFGDSMVLQRDKPLRIWGWTEPNIDVRVTLASRQGTTKSERNGRFEVTLDPLPAGGPHELTIRADETKTFRDVLIGEVWLCSGESNMAWPVANAEDSDLELVTSKYPKIRLLSVPHIGAREPQDDVKGRWQACTPETAVYFSAIGYYFGRQLHQSLDVPIGLIDNAWAGTTVEAWMSRTVLETAGNCPELLAKWDALDEAEPDRPAVVEWDDRLRDWDTIRHWSPSERNRLLGNQRPADVYNGVVHPFVGFAIRGVIWQQGESNVDRAHQYRHLFPLLIQSWRDAWKQGDFPFYWVQLSGFGSAAAKPSESRWAELREAQTMARSKLPNTGEVVTVDLGSAIDLHPRNKQEVARRLARWALTRTYRFSNPLSPEGGIAHHSPVFSSLSVEGPVATVKFRHPNGGLTTTERRPPVGFTIAGEDRVFVPAHAKIVDRWGTVEVWSDNVAKPVAVRYAWADNPVYEDYGPCNMYGGLPMTPFRTDDWPGVTVGIVE